MRPDILRVVVQRNNVPIAKSMDISLKIAMYQPHPTVGADSNRLCRNVMDVEKVDIRIVIVLKEDVKLVES